MRYGISKAIMVISLLLLYVILGDLSGQSFYDINTIQKIELLFSENEWAEILDDYYVAGQGERLTADIIINGTRLDSVGVRYKGFSSVSVDRAKNPFNIKLDYVRNQSYDGIDKIKLGNVIHDPTFVREALSYEVARKYMPASRANFAELYANGEYLGLYSNVEAVNKEFLSKNFNSSSGPFFKGNPEDLDFNGENSNLSDSPGMDTTAYFPLYDMESESGWVELVDFIDILNQDPDRIEEVLNVDRALWMHAFNYAVVNLDSYIGYAQNYYIYQENGLFHTIPWDLNMSFGSFRITDASDNFDGFSINAAKVLDPLAHYNSVSVYPRPLMRNLFQNDTYRRMFLAHLRTIILENFAQKEYVDRIAEMQALIRNSVFADENKFYTDTGFTSNVSMTYTDLIQYPGLTELMDERSEYLLEYPGIESVVDVNLINQIDVAPVGSTVDIMATSQEVDVVYLMYRYGSEGKFQTIEMAETPVQFWSVQLPMEDRKLEYYLYGENSISGQFLPSRAAHEYYTIRPEVEGKLPFNDVVINEFMASNSADNADEEGEYDDWIELYNTTNEDISLDGLYLSDKEDQPDKWALPDTTLASASYMIVWADEDGGQGPLHANFKLSSGGEAIYLSYADGTRMDSVIFGEQITDQTTGRLPNGTGPFVPLIPTFNGPNNAVSVDENSKEIDFNVFPNPVKDVLFLEYGGTKPIHCSLYSVLGEEMRSFVVDSNTPPLDMSSYRSGLYILQVAAAEQILNYTITKF